MKIIGLAAFVILTFQLTSYSQAGSAAATWQVQKYDLDVTLPQEASRVVTVRALLSVKNISGKPASTLTLRIAPSAEVTAVRINEGTADFTKNEEKINAATNLQRVAVRFASMAPDAVVSAAIDYKLTLKDNSALSAVSPTAAQLLPLSFWYPTPNSWFFARGADTAPVRLKVNAPAGQTVVAPGTDTAGVFDQKLLGQPFFLAGNWDVLNQNGIAVYTPKGSAGAEKRAAELAALFSDAKSFAAGILGKAPEVPLRIVASRRGAGFSSGGMVVVDEAVFRRSKIDSLTAMNIAEAAAKLWLSNAVAVKGDGHGVISEGLSRYIATQFIESKFGKDVADVERLRQRNAYAAVSRRDQPMATVAPIEDFYYTEVANKGAMAWRLLAKRIGAAEFAKTLQANMQDADLNVAELRAAFSANKELLDYLFDQVTDMNLLVGLPQAGSAETKVALRNLGATDVAVDIAATTANGERLVTPATIKATNLGEVVFRTPQKIVRVEVDVDKLYPQTDYSDDIAPRETTDSDPLLAAKRPFDKQEYIKAEATSRMLLRDYPRLDDVRILLGRSLLAQNKLAEAEREFRAVLDEKLPTARSLAWANVGLAESAARANQNEAALQFAETAIRTDAEYGASLAARNLRSRLGQTPAVDAAVRTFFADFDKAAASNRKADLDALVMPGEVTRFASGVSGSTETWQTQIRHVDRIDANTLLVEANMTVKLLTKETETGIAVYRLTRAGTGWKLSAVEMFEVR
ncbi:MAG TPA: hypothetical protein VNA17_09565 [Pyrinomonadaceae bacterium]|nr:hypothetical protein [Pyrinomonadaceae bacterium]